ncbi:hypothetical protein BU25DRAFT_474507 [Macroventuria anomochaeta]|uniref:Uncharacterized protein n=1 Tax=Macroventuria anomochaeta TaxID=301207 RepID=A0ACB6RV24_9PLEO|nr:uncharacterized protein BU25DRAFT_474507 [Macroventuria anomochaeta]KAF2624989.1 hypothetical protein BU25DRAFT_474507 [Macroventuria anomochaeta]
MADTPHTITQLEQQARLERGLLQRQSQSPTSRAISQLVKVVSELSIQRQS